MHKARGMKILRQNNNPHVILHFPLHLYQTIQVHPKCPFVLGVPFALPIFD